MNMQRFFSFVRRLASARGGTAAVEFIGIAPAIAILMFGVVDFGDILYTRFRLNAAVAAGSNYALSRADDVITTAAPTVAQNAAAIVANTTASGWANSTVVVNNGPTASVTAGTATNPPATTAQQVATTNGLCYCPTTAATWTAGTCSAACPSSAAPSGRFVKITAKRQFTPMFSSYGIVTDGYITVSNLVQTG